MDETKWHLDKRVPLALIAALVLQTGAVFAWAAKTDERIAFLERAVSNSNDLSQRLTRIEVLVEQTNSRLDREDRRR